MLLSSVFIRCARDAFKQLEAAARLSSPLGARVPFEDQSIFTAASKAPELPENLNVLHDLAAPASTGFTSSISTSFGASGRASRTQEQRAQLLEDRLAEVYPELEHLGLTQQQVKKVLQSRRKNTVMRSSTAQHLKARLGTIYQLTAAHTAEQRQIINKQLMKHPSVLSYGTERLEANAAQLYGVMQHRFDLQAGSVQQLIARQVGVLACKSDSVADKVSAWAESLDMDVLQVMHLWCSNPSQPLSMYSASATRVEGDCLQSGSPPSTDSAAEPASTASDSSIERKVAVLLQCFGPHGWTRQRPGQAVLKHPSVLSRSPHTLKRKWDVFQQYAAMHPPSWQQLQGKIATSAGLSIFHTPERNLQLMQYVMQVHAQQPLAAQQTTSAQVSSSPAGANSSQLKTYQRCGKEKQTPSANDVDQQQQSVPTEAPMLWCFVIANTTYHEKMAAKYPGFQEWQQQQQEKKGPAKDA